MVLVGTAKSVAILLLALLVIALVITDLVAVKRQQEDTASLWMARVRLCRNRIVAAIPLTAIKIVLVAWQILTQV